MDAHPSASSQGPKPAGIPDPALLAVLRLAPRRYRMPELPPTLKEAASLPNETVLAFAIESARLAKELGGVPQAQQGEAFVEALASLIRRAMAPEQGDPIFQAQVLHAQDLRVQAWAQLATLAAGDERSLRGAVDAFAHPGKLRDMANGPMRSQLEALHALADSGDWETLALGAASLDPQDDASLHASLQKLLANPALQRRQQAQALRSADAVRRYVALKAKSTLETGSAAAIEQGRASARAGELTEREAAFALGSLAGFLSARGTSRHRVVRSLRTPAQLTGATAGRAKEEWDAAILKDAGEGTESVVLIAEAKAAPAAATTDLPRLLRGLDQLSAADAHAALVFRSADGELRLRGDSLRALHRTEAALPAQVIYLCTAPVETRTALLGAAARALLMSEKASLQFAADLGAGRHPSPASLMAVWEAVIGEPRLRPVLDQYDTARRAREAMLHPQDLLAAVDEAGRRSRTQSVD